MLDGCRWIAPKQVGNKVMSDERVLRYAEVRVATLC